MAERSHFMARLLGTREGWPENMTGDEQRIMGEHFVYLKELVGAGKVLLAGPVFDPEAAFGLIVLEVESEAEARAIVEADPSVKAGLHRFTLAPMRASLLLGREE